MDNKEIVTIELTNETIESMIYVIRGKRVMLDFDLARIYGYSTKAFNQQVNRNIDKFPERYRFQLESFEVEYLVRSQNVTSRIWPMSNEGGRRYLPYAFTEQGIYMLMTVLKGDLATKQSIILIDTFKNMKDYILENNSVSSINDVIKLTNQVNENTLNIKEMKNDLKVVMDNFVDPSTYKHYLILNGERIEANLAYQSIYKLAKYSIYIIDNYIDVKTLSLLKICNKDIKIIIFSDNYLKLDDSFINDFKKDTKRDNIVVKKNNGMFHDRYIVIDYNTDNYLIYHSGGSSKDGGNKISTINRIEDKDAYRKLIDEILNK